MGTVEAAFAVLVKSQCRGHAFFFFCGRIVDIRREKPESHDITFLHSRRKQIFCREEYTVSVPVRISCECRWNIFRDCIFLRRRGSESELLIYKMGAIYAGGGSA